MALDLAAVRAGLKTRVATITGLRVYDTVPDSPQLPAAVIKPGEPYIEYHLAMNGGLARVNLQVQLLVNRSQGAERAQAEIDTYLAAGSGATGSVIDAVEDDRTLGGAVDDTMVTSAGDTGTVTAGGYECVTATVNVTAILPRT